MNKPEKTRSIDHPLGYLIPAGATSFAEVFAPESLFVMESRLTREESDILPSEIADAIEANPGTPLPPQTRERVCLLLRGKYKGKPGPKPSLFDQVYSRVARLHYYRRLKELQAARAGGAIGKTRRGGAALHRRAALDTIEEFGLKVSVERFLNSLSEEKSKQIAETKRTK